MRSAMLTHGFAGPNYRNNSDKQKKYNLPELLGRIEDGKFFIDTEYAVRPENCEKFPECPHIVFSADETTNFFVYKQFENSETEKKYYYRFAHVYDDKMFIIVDEDNNSYQMWPLVYHDKWEGSILAFKKPPPTVIEQEEQETKDIIDKSQKYSKQGGVYLLFKGDDIVYIGMSENNIGNRVKWHRSKKVFDKVMCINISNANHLHYTGIESVLIKVFKPKYNKSIVGTGWTRKTKAFCRALSRQEDVTTIDWEYPQLGFHEKDYPITIDILPNLKDISNEFSWYGKWDTVKQYISEHSEYISQATIEGLARAKQAGKKLGRKPTIDSEVKSNIIKEKLDGSSLAQIAEKYSISRSSVQHVMREYKSAS